MIHYEEIIELSRQLESIANGMANMVHAVETRLIASLQPRQYQSRNITTTPPSTTPAPRPPSPLSPPSTLSLSLSARNTSGVCRVRPVYG